jgi:hypothetical protein
LNQAHAPDRIIVRVEAKVDETRKIDPPIRQIAGEMDTKFLREPIHFWSPPSRSQRPAGAW